jgi:hypothetical protein
LRGAEPTDLEPRGARDGAESEGASSSHVGSADLPFWAPPNGQNAKQCLIKFGHASRAGS